MNMKKKIKYPETPIKANYIGKWHIAIQVDGKRIWFWDGKSVNPNFFYFTKPF